jgi:hypothetical protein
MLAEGPGGNVMHIASYNSVLKLELADTEGETCLIIRPVKQSPVILTGHQQQHNELGHCLMFSLSCLVGYVSAEGESAGAETAEMVVLVWTALQCCPCRLCSGITALTRLQ